MTVMEIAGKSTLATTLFRLQEPTKGSIWIDGVDISTIGLETLRSKLSIIPQDPVLFAGTVRYNLDPFDQHDETALWRALEQSYMREAVEAMPKKLEAPVQENGSNLSVGERQLLCLARALLRDSRILIMDEATSAADSRTDQKIQATVREAFVGKRTLLTIAHRLDTILNSDRIMVLDQGHIAEFNTPATLLADPASQLSSLVHSHEEAHRGTRRRRSRRE